MDAQRARSPYPLRAPATTRALPFPVRVKNFWNRVSNGMKLNELWDQLQSDARSTYRLYSREIDAARPAGEPGHRHFFSVARQFFWAILEKLTPARRILLLAALVLLLLPEATPGTSAPGHWQFQFDTRLAGGVIILVILIMELTDRVVMKRDLQIAKEIQAWLLPARPPQVPGLEIAFATRPANTVAGDYYDVFPRRGWEAPDADAGGGSFLIAVADVAGKSVPAAMLMATIQASLRTLCTTPGPLTELAERMNRYTCSNSQNGRRFTTAFLAEYEPSTRALTYVNAGHNPPILRHPNGVTEELKDGGLPLGVMESAAYESRTVTLERGDLLAVYTDGLVEAENIGTDEYGEARFRSMLEMNAGIPAEAALRNIFFDIDRFVGRAPQHDDVTLMVVKAT